MSKERLSKTDKLLTLLERLVPALEKLAKATADREDRCSNFYKNQRDFYRRF